MADTEKLIEVLAVLSNDYRKAIAALLEADAPPGLVAHISSSWQDIGRALDHVAEPEPEQRKRREGRGVGATLGRCHEFG